MLKYQIGHAESHQDYVIDPETGLPLPLKMPADAVMPEARPGIKAGNPMIDINEREIRTSKFIKKVP